MPHGKRRPPRTPRQTPPEGKASFWEKVAKKHAFLYATTITAIVTAVVTLIVTDAPKNVRKLFDDDRPKITLTDDSATLADLSMAYEDIIGKPDAVPDGGVKAGETRTKMVIYNSTGATIRVLDIQAKVLKRSDPLHGTLLSQSSQGSPSEVMGIALWQEPAIARVLSGADELGESFFSVQSIEVAAGVSQVVEITAIPDRHYYEYALEVSYARGEKRQTVEVKNDSLKVTGYAPSYGAAYEGLPGNFLAIDQARVERIARSPGGS